MNRLRPHFSVGSENPVKSCFSRQSEDSVDERSNVRTEGRFASLAFSSALGACVDLLILPRAHGRSLRWAGPFYSSNRPDIFAGNDSRPLRKNRGKSYLSGDDLHGRAVAFDGHPACSKDRSLEKDEFMETVPSQRFTSEANLGE